MGVVDQVDLAVAGLVLVQHPRVARLLRVHLAKPVGGIEDAQVPDDHRALAVRRESGAHCRRILVVAGVQITRLQLANGFDVFQPLDTAQKG